VRAKYVFDSLDEVICKVVVVNGGGAPVMTAMQDGR
jgi:hypothetical protein